MAFGFRLWTLGEAQSLEPEVQGLIEPKSEQHRERLGLDIGDAPGVVAVQHVAEAAVPTAFHQEPRDFDAAAKQDPQIETLILALHIQSIQARLKVDIENRSGQAVHPDAVAATGTDVDAKKDRDFEVLEVRAPG